MKPLNKYSLIAPCGINCGVCRAYLKKKNKFKVGLERVLVRCPGCRRTDAGKPGYCVKCRIKNCSVFRKDGAKYCFKCGDFPCNRLKHLDKRYRTKYNMSMIENLGNIEKFGIKKFIKNENIKWSCSECEGTICVHDGFCIECGKKK
jgi:hypothetical protein